MSWLDRLRGKRKDSPLSDRNREIERIQKKVQDPDFEVEEYLPDDALAELAEDREAMGEDFEYPTEPVPTLEESLDPEWLQRKLHEGKRMADKEGKRKIKEMQEKFSDADIDWSKEYGQVVGIPGVVYTQDGKYFNGQGKEVIYEEK